MTDKILLHPGDRFPALTLALTGGGTLCLPDDLAGHFSVILFYRGSWCPYCNAQLRAFQRSLDRLTGLGVLVAALSVDDEATTKNLVAKHGLRFPIGHSADARAVAAATGAFINHDPAYLQSTGFILDPSGRVVVSVYSSGAIGRLLPDDVIGLVRYLREHANASQPSSRDCRVRAGRSHDLDTHSRRPRPRRGGC
jgi:peroxiredoxin